MELKEWAEKLRIAVYEKKIPAPIKDVADYVTVSIGASLEYIDDREIQYESILANADKNLYEAKRNGRNRVVISSR